VSLDPIKASVFSEEENRLLASILLSLDVDRPYSLKARKRRKERKVFIGILISLESEQDAPRDRRS